MANKFETKKWELEEYGDIYEWLDRRIESYGVRFGKLDEEEQAREWNEETRRYERVWEDEEKTIPKMTQKWGDIVIPEDELTEDVLAKREVCEAIKAFIDKQI